MYTYMSTLDLYAPTPSISQALSGYPTAYVPGATDSLAVSHETADLTGLWLL